MDISGISASQASAAGSLSGGKELDKDAFMQLLVTQLKNQDPMQPQANEEFIAQLASFSSLEQMELLNENIVGMVYLQQSNALMDQLTSSSALIGQKVEWTDAETGLAQTGVVESVKIEDGLATLLVDGSDVPLVEVTKVLGTGTGESGDGEPAEDDGAGAAEEAGEEQ